PPYSALSPYTTLFRSPDGLHRGQRVPLGDPLPAPAHSRALDHGGLGLGRVRGRPLLRDPSPRTRDLPAPLRPAFALSAAAQRPRDRKSTRLNSSHVKI